MNQQHGGTVNTKRKPLSPLALALVAGLSVAAPQSGEAADVHDDVTGIIVGQGIAAPQKGGASIKTTQGVDNDTGIAAPPKIGNDKAGFGSGSGGQLKDTEGGTTQKVEAGMKVPPKSTQKVGALAAGAPPPVQVVLPSQEKPIPGVDIIVKKKPGDQKIHAQTDAQGVYQFNQLAPGEYELIIPGKPNQTLTVGPDGKLGGQLKGPAQPPLGKAGIAGSH